MIDLLDQYDWPWHKYAGYSTVALAYLKYRQYEKAKEYSTLSAEYVGQSGNTYRQYACLVVEGVELFREILADLYEYGGGQ